MDCLAEDEEKKVRSKATTLRVDGMLAGRVESAEKSTRRGETESNTASGAAISSAPTVASSSSAPANAASSSTAAAAAAGADQLMQLQVMVSRE